MIYRQERLKFAKFNQINENRNYQPFFSDRICRNLTGGASPFGSRIGSTRAPIAALPVRADTGGADNVTDSTELFASLCSVLLLLFDGANDEYTLDDIEGFLVIDSFDKVEFISCDGSGFDIVIDLVIVRNDEGRG